MSNILGIDPGTNSIGLSLRNPDNGNTLQEQLEFFSSVIFKSGSGKDDKGFSVKSYAGERTKYRSPRRLYQARKYRIWETLEILIDFGFCPLSKNDLEKWSKYDKSRGLKRQYPIDAIAFEQWVRLDFNGDDVADYSSPYQLRAELMEQQFDFSNETDRFKLGRALYHIAQRRGFKSSKGETIKEQEKATDENSANLEAEVDMSVELKKSELKKSSKLTAYMEKHNLRTVGCAYAHLEKSGIRVRNSEYQAVRSQYKEEIQKIFEFQNGLDIKGDFYKHIISERKREGSIFYKRPLRSQKGLVGKCTLEPNKSRCPISHPEYEKFRAWSFINNIKYRKRTSDIWSELTIEQKTSLFNKEFVQVRSNFKFQKIREWIEREIREDSQIYQLQYTRNIEDRTINYKDNTNVSGCPISGRLKNLLGENWETITIETDKERVNKKNGVIHNITYTAESLWHICFTFDDAEYVEEFAKSDLKFDDKKSKELVRIWGAIPQGYGMLSLKAIKNINRFLQMGLIYSDATLLAKLPDMFGEERWKEYEAKIISQLASITEQNRQTKLIFNLTNNLIANYKSLDQDDRFAEYNTDYILRDTDYNGIPNYIKGIKEVVRDNFGKKIWEEMAQDEKENLIKQVAIYYQQFFASDTRDYFKLPKLGDAIKQFISNSIDFLHCQNNFVNPQNKHLPCNCSACKKLNKLYHPSMIEFYTPAKDEFVDGRYLKLLGSPVIGALKNPMAMRTMHILRKQINALIKDGKIDGESTRIVIENAREMNDANMRWAIETYQREREKENKEYEIAIAELINDSDFKGIANPKSDEDIDKLRIWFEQANQETVSRLDSKGKPLAKSEQGWKTYGYTTSKLMLEVLKCKTNAVKKYRLWKEQNFRCIYTGQMISLSDLFTPHKVDFEHTIPRSISFDNSLANLTVCDTHFNRTIKKNKIPAQLSNYNDILVRIQPWMDKVEQLKDNIEFWKGQSKRAQDKERKDYCIRQKHLWQMELDYWKNKVERFTMTEVTSGFRNSQLVDTRIISKYIYHYLKTVFNKVEVQKGSVTADFRKMLGVQSLDEKKNRDKHSHHAIDATILTLIPVPAKRDKMLELFYKKEEEKRFNGETELYHNLCDQLNAEIAQCGFGKDISSIKQFIESNILVNHISKDNTLVPASKRLRVRGKVVPKRDSSGKVIYEKDQEGNFKLNKRGHRIPEAKHWITGDSIRGKLHGATFYGAITQAQKDEKGNFLRNSDGSIKTDEQLYFVVRRELKHEKNTQDTGFSNWDELENVIVDKALFRIMKSQFDEGLSFKDACETGIYMLDKNGNKVNKIRHIRCYADTTYPIIVKKHTYLSSKEYKQYYYAKNGENVYYALYWDDKTDSAKGYDYRSLMQLAQMKQVKYKNINEYFEPTIKVGRGRVKKDVPLYAVLRNNTKVLFYTPDEWKISKNLNDIKQMLSELSESERQKRLYIFSRLFPDGRIEFKHHLEARNDTKLGQDFPTEKFGKSGTKGFSKVDINNPYPKLLISPTNMNYLVEDRDFEIRLDGSINFKF